MNNIKGFMTLLLSGSLLTASIFLSSCFISDFFAPEDVAIIAVERTDDNASEEISEDELDQLLNNAFFLETFNTFFYPNSTVQEAMAVNEKQEMIYVILETHEEFAPVEEYYKNKKIQSIWNRDFIYQKSMAELEEDFIESEEENVQISKFTYSSKDRDKIVDILIKELDYDRTQIMITCWNLK